MPNWCLNHATISHSDPEMIVKVNQAFEQDKLFATFAPLPTSDGEWEYGAATETWGTKWEANRIDYDTYENSTNLTFDTAWGPPIEFYEKLIDQGFEVSACYIETGMGFAGVFEDGIDEQYDYDFSNPNWRDDIDNQDVVDMLEEEYAMFLEMNCEQEEED